MAENRKIVYPGLGHRGRLGNQLWQIASTLGIARSRGCEPLFPQEWTYRSYFSCPDSWFGDIQPKDTQAEVFATHIDPRVRGYLQDLKLWGNVEAEIRAAFEPSDLARQVTDDQWATLIPEAGPPPYTAVHIRRGDYATNPTGTINALAPSWYRQALPHAGEGTSIVFSDDPQWCMDEFGLLFDGYFQGSPRPKEQEEDYNTAPVLDWIDLFLMARCDRHVISNSTYSWWGAWLSTNERPVYPGAWYGSQLSYVDWRAMIPHGWIEVPVEE